MFPNPDEMLIQETSVALRGWFALSMTAHAYGLLMNLSPWRQSTRALARWERPRSIAGMPIATFSLVALDCPDSNALAAFYQGIVGGELDTKFADLWTVLRTEVGADIAFQQVNDYVAPDWPCGAPQQAHLDLDVADLDAGEAAVLDLGARKADTQPSPDNWRVFLDPVGHPFCLVKV